MNTRSNSSQSKGNGNVVGALLPFLVVAMLLIAPTAGQAKPPPAGSCPDVLFIGARGSGESGSGHHGMGKPVDYMGTRLGDLLWSNQRETLGFQAVRYEAAPVSKLYPSSTEATLFALNPALLTTVYVARHLRPYLASIEDGVDKAVGEVKSASSRCPDTELVLAGYSQGAMASHQAERRLLKEDEDALEAIGGTLLLGDGDRMPGTKAKLIGGASRFTSGIRVALGGIATLRDVVEPETTVEICAAGDLVCDYAPSSLFAAATARSKGGIHSSYGAGRRSLLDQSVDWLAREMGIRE
jgi:hypothetical protein